MCDSTLFMVSIPIALCTAPNNHATLFVYSTESICLCTISRHITNKTVMIKTVNTMRSVQLATPIPAPSTASVCKYPPHHHTATVALAAVSVWMMWGVFVLFLLGGVFCIVPQPYTLLTTKFFQKISTPHTTHDTTLHYNLHHYHDP